MNSKAGSRPLFGKKKINGSKRQSLQEKLRIARKEQREKQSESNKKDFQRQLLASWVLTLQRLRQKQMKRLTLLKRPKDSRPLPTVKLKFGLAEDLDGQSD